MTDQQFEVAYADACMQKARRALDLAFDSDIESEHAGLLVWAAAALAREARETLDSLAAKEIVVASE